MAIKLNSEDCAQFDLAKKCRKSVFSGGMKRAEEGRRGQKKRLMWVGGRAQGALEARRLNHTAQDREVW